MLFDVIAKTVLGKFTGLATQPIIESLQIILINDKALNFAKEGLRKKYEKLVQPASYEHVIDNLRLTKEDFFLYFKTATNQSQQQLREFLRSQLMKRSDEWIYNRPNRELFDKLVEDFLNAYESYFITTDPQLTTLNILNNSREILEIVYEIRSAIRTEPDLFSKASYLKSNQISEDVTSFLTITNIPFEIIEKSKNHIDVIITDPSSIFATRFYLSAINRITESNTIDNLLDRVRTHGRFSHILLVVADPISFELASYAENRGITYNSFREFRDAFLKISPTEKYIIGSLASQALLETYNIQEIYIEPDAVSVTPGDYVENKVLDIRESAIQLIEDFLGDTEQKILFIFGSYGSGKSALCSHLTNKYTKHGIFTPIYISLRQLLTADDLMRVVTKADQLAKTINANQRNALVFLDGLDELPNAMVADEKRHNMLRLLQAATRTDKIIVSVRTTYFRGLEDFWHLFMRDDENSLWSDIAKFIPQSHIRPKISAIILREFDSAQMSLYVEEFAQMRGLDSNFPSEFFKDMEFYDPGYNYRMLARNPLYLFLLVNSMPWKNKDVTCFAEVLELFIRYWMERDIEKGKSRWMLTTQDRLEFIDAVAWWMFQQNRLTISFNEFDELVKQYYGSSLSKSDLTSLSLDLQTTGTLLSAGGLMTFIIPGFMDYFVAIRFLHNKFYANELPRSLPSSHQTRLWIGLVETRKEGFVGGGEKFLKNIGVAMRKEFLNKLNIQPNNIIYKSLPKEWDWPFINSAEDLRIIINAALYYNEVYDESELKIRIVNNLGLHARASAFLVTRYILWLNQFPSDRKISMKLVRDNRSVNIGSIMAVMMLAAAKGTMLKLSYENCTRDEVESFLRQLRCVPEKEGSSVWIADFGFMASEERAYYFKALEHSRKDHSQNL